MAGLRLRIISGGQSGVDRAALDFAIAQGIAYGGWCPRGGWAEDFPHPPGVRAKYPGLAPTPRADPQQRTRWNVRDSDATLILVAQDAGVSQGTAFTLACAQELARPHLVIGLGETDALRAVQSWIADVAPHRLNIAGPRESESPGIYRAAMNFLNALL